MKGKQLKKVSISTLVLSLAFSALGFGSLKKSTADAAAMSTVITSTFENQSIDPWASNGNSTHSIVTGGQDGYALKSTLKDGKTQNRIQRRISANDLKEDTWYEFSVYLKADEATTMSGFVYFNANTAKELTVISGGTAVNTEWTKYSFGYSYNLTDNGCELSFRRPNMSSPASHTFTDINTSVTSFDLIFMTSANTWYMDSFAIETEVKTAEFKSAIINNDFEDDSITPWTSSYSTLTAHNDGYNGEKSMRVARIGDSGQNRFQTNVSGVAFKEDVWTTLSYAARATGNCSMEVIIYFNVAGISPQYLYLVTDATKLTENWQEYEAGFSFKRNGETFELLFQRPNMDSPAAHSFAIPSGATLTSVDIVIMSSTAATMYFDDICLSTPSTVSAAAGKVITMIDALGTITSESKADVDAAVAAYEALTDEQKAEVFNYDVLKSAQHQLTLLGGLVKGTFNEEEIVFRFGAISDTHNHNTEQALQVLSAWQGKTMDALILTGDLTDRTEYDNNLREIPLVKTCFETYLSNDVELFFALGNHDSSNGSHAADFYDGFGERFYRAYEDKAYTRETANGYAKLGGYHFIAIEADYTTETIPEHTMQYLQSKLEAIVSAPDYNGEYIFILSHVSPSGTVDSSSPISTMNALLAQYPQAVVLTGHSHSTLYSEMAIMQTDFTTINLGSVSYTPFEGTKYLESLDYGLIEGSYDLSVGTMMEIDSDGNIKITRIDFAQNAQIGEPWILPAPKADKSHLMAYPKERKTIFAEAPVWENPDIVATTVKKNAVEITFDTATDDRYVHSYLIELFSQGASEPYYTVESLSGFYLYPNASDMPKTKTVYLESLKQLPATVRITPKDTVGLTATPYTATVEKSENTNVLTTSVLKINPDTFDYTLDEIYELSTSADFATVLPNSGSIESYLNMTLYVREKETLFMQASAYVSITVQTYTVQFATGEGYTIYVAKEKEKYFVNEEVEFSVSVEYPTTYKVTVKANGETLTADKDGIYSLIVTQNTQVTVELKEYERYEVTLTSTEGVTFINLTESTSIVEGGTFQFKVETQDGYGATQMVVKANGKILTAKNGVYTVVISGDTTITVSGVSKIQTSESTAGCGSSMGISAGVTLLGACVVVMIKRRKK